MDRPFGGKVLQPKLQTVLPSGYRLGMVDTQYCDEEESDFYQKQTGVLRLTAQIGRNIITAAVSMLALYIAAPRQRHLIELFHMFSYLRC
jgi:hypothetical protein